MDAAHAAPHTDVPTRKVPLHLAPRPRAPNVNRVLVTAYKLVGFGVLTAILLGLLSYFGVNLFYLVDRHWILPAIISPSDERVLHLNEQEAEQASLRQKLLVERYDLQAKLKDANRVIEVEGQFQGRFSGAVQGDVQARRAELHRLQDLFTDYAATKAEILTSNKAYSGLSRERNQELLDAHLEAQDNYVNNNFQLSQIAHGNLSLAENEANLFARTSELEHEIVAMEGTRRAHGGPALSYESLRMAQEFEHSTLEEARARDQREALQQSIQAIDISIGNYDRMLKEIRESPYLKAVERNLNVAFMPYENAGGRDHRHRPLRLPLRPRRLPPRRQAGRAAGRRGPHQAPPAQSELLRGVMVELELTDSAWARPQGPLRRQATALLLGLGLDEDANEPMRRLCCC